MTLRAGKYSETSGYWVLLKLVAVLLVKLTHLVNFTYLIAQSSKALATAAANEQCSEPVVITCTTRGYTQPLCYTLYASGLKHEARGPHAAPERVQCGPRTS